MIFGRNSSFTGFRGTAISAYNNVDPSTIIRELLQNSLDAANLANKEKIEVEFDLNSVITSKIPGIDLYRKHFYCAISSQKMKGNYNQSAHIVKTIQETINKDKIQVLWVSDNGIGLNDERMEHLLGDGFSAKDDASTAGSYGNGHMTTFPASDMRYVLYGGVHSKGRTVSGHAILASHMYNNYKVGGDGYLAKNFNQDAMMGQFEFLDGSTTPLLQIRLDDIKEKFNTGSVVGILGFNYFNKYTDEEQLVNKIASIAAMHFTPLLYNDKMEIRINTDNGKQYTVNKNTLIHILEINKGRRRREKRSIGPSGAHCWDIFKSLDSTYRKSISTSYGDVCFHFREFDSESEGNTNLQLFRNGMWITNNLPNNETSGFKDRIPFNGVCLLEHESANEACKLVQEFEGPRHIDIELSRLNKSSLSRKRIESFFKELHDAIKSFTRKIDNVAFDLDFFTLDLSGDITKNNQAPKSAGIGTPEKIPNTRVNTIPNNSSNTNKKVSKNQIRRDGRRIMTLHTEYQEENGLTIFLKPLKDCINAELRVLIPSGADITCDSPILDTFIEIKEGATLNGRHLKNKLNDGAGRPVAAIIGTLKNGVELEFWLPDAITSVGKIQVEIIERDIKKDKD